MIFILLVFLSFGYGSEFDPTKHKNWNLLPHETCGQVNSDRIIGGEETPLSAFPWLARIGLVTSDSSNASFRCGGAVINSRTILTAAHCVYGLPKGFKVGVIRLGEHDIETNPDCDEKFCADPVTDVAPSEILIPENYSSKTLIHDLALIRSKEEIKFSTSIRPICFGNEEIIKKDYIGSSAKVAGWGVYDIENPKHSIRLQVVDLKILNNEECAKLLPSNYKIGPKQMCVGGMEGKDSCGGDSGGPLMKLDDGINGPSYYLLGVVSYGPKKCGKSKMPGVYTKVSSYSEWILNNLEIGSTDSIKVL